MSIGEVSLPQERHVLGSCRECSTVSGLLDSDATDASNMAFAAFPPSSEQLQFAHTAWSLTVYPLRQKRSSGSSTCLGFC